jgi:hypothetical protein
LFGKHAGQPGNAVRVDDAGIARRARSSAIIGFGIPLEFVSGLPKSHFLIAGA